MTAKGEVRGIILQSLIMAQRPIQVRDAFWLEVDPFNQPLKTFLSRTHFGPRCNFACSSIFLNGGRFGLTPYEVMTLIICEPSIR
ncbi:MAG: hypothetical protein QOF72_1552, partial [Blastocatellia bacterium]|nr:hypothetical protein [Blastocatellia bacterium]